ncbi:hypothetical protein RchiOBHm_Chr2g0165851 [Rosa chinensis]|uniref:Uncharacterized protein n=1 Tax=Rosa chinensis TaxID=74649 RepID=A0A2P6S3X5_ROSCH|nr:hypothetical protein RchiOBHm_Chr2g0165851 [Rosa chinensis]
MSPSPFFLLGFPHDQPQPSIFIYSSLPYPRHTPTVAAATPKTEAALLGCSLSPPSSPLFFLFTLVLF